MERWDCLVGFQGKLRVYLVKESAARVHSGLLSLSHFIDDSHRRKKNPEMKI